MNGAADLEGNPPRRNSRFLDYNGERRILSEWARLYGLSSKTLANRIDAGWPMERALRVKKYDRFFP